MLPKNASANVAQIQNLVHERNILRAALEKVIELVDEELGEWSAVSELYQPERLHFLNNIREVCTNAIKEETK